MAHSSFNNNPCFSFPCSNSGTCYSINSLTYGCLCPNGYTGTNCQTILSGCSSSPCQNGGTCSSNNNGTIPYYTCACANGYTGQNCETGKLGNSIINDNFFLKPGRLVSKHFFKIKKKNSNQK